MRWRCGRFFTDTIERLSARLLVDETATRAETSLAFLGALSAAEEDDRCFSSPGSDAHGKARGTKVKADKASTCFIRYLTCEPNAVVALEIVARGEREDPPTVAA
jgi:hypothetical protein